MNHCSRCGQLLELRTLPNDSRARQVCPSCSTVNYAGPRVLVGAVLHWKDQILMVRRATEPAYGLWSIPTGFMEEGESLQDAAAREVMEEAGVHVSAHQLELSAVLSIPRLSEVYVVFRGALTSAPQVTVGPECLEVTLRRESEIAREELAFADDLYARRSMCYEEIRTGRFSIHLGIIAEPGSPGEHCRYLIAQGRRTGCR